MKTTWDKLVSKKRINIKNEDSHEEFYRSSFHKDYDRIIFSNSFRRLSKKTQVHPLSNNDHVHNRLTHSLEVASLGRSFGLQAGLIINEKYPEADVNPHDIGYIIQTACLAHDIGNPPFGHAGEEVIKEWFIKHRNHDLLKPLSEEEKNDFEHLDGNAQSFRIVSKIENDSFAGGMNLTFATLGTLIKYPYSSDQCEEKKKSKFNFFQSEKEFFDILFKTLGLKKKDGTYRRHPFSYLMELADDICYGLLDLKDAVELGIFNIHDLEDIFLLMCDKEKVQETLNNSQYTDSKKTSKLIAISMGNIAIHAMEVFEHNIDNILFEDNQPSDLIELFENPSLKEGIIKAKKLGQSEVFNAKRKIELELGAYNIIEILLGHFIRAAFSLYQVKDRKDLSFRDKRVLDLMGKDKIQVSDNLYHMYQMVLDYIIGMTDNHATYLAKQLTGLGK